MTEQQAKQLFASLMQLARKRELTTDEKRALMEARQALRRRARPAMNPSVKRFAWTAVTEDGALTGGLESSMQKVKQIKASRKWQEFHGGKLTRQLKKEFTPKKSNPSGVKIYGRILRIEAQKTQAHICDAACKRAKHCYFHDFTTRNASIYGMPDGSLVVK